MTFKVGDRVRVWADEIVVMNESQAKTILERTENKPVVILDIEDSYPFRDPELVKLIAEKYIEASKPV